MFKKLLNKEQIKEDVFWLIRVSVGIAILAGIIVIQKYPKLHLPISLVFLFLGLYITIGNICGIVWSAKNEFLNIDKRFSPVPLVDTLCYVIAILVITSELNFMLMFLAIPIAMIQYFIYFLTDKTTLLFLKKRKKHN